MQAMVRVVKSAYWLMSHSATVPSAFGSISLTSCLIFSVEKSISCAALTILKM